jgi:hypothetical protein
MRGEARWAFGVAVKEVTDRVARNVMRFLNEGE